jgi:hypothetical protein
MWACPNVSDAHPMLIRYEWRKKWEVNNFGELTSGKSSAFGYKLSALGVVPGDGTKVWGIYI